MSNMSGDGCCKFYEAGKGAGMQRGCRGIRAGSLMMGNNRRDTKEVGACAMHVPEGREVQDKGRARPEGPRQGRTRTCRELPGAGSEGAKEKWEGRVTGQLGQALGGQNFANATGNDFH